MPATPPVSVIVPVLNEERNLAGCLASLRDFTDVFVVDSGSTDGTRAVARHFNREVIDFHWNGRFPKKRNWALEHCALRHEWVLFLDADERVTPAFVDEIRAMLQSTSLNGFLLTYDNWFLGKMLRHGDPMRKIALVRRGCGAYERTDEEAWSRFDAEVHEHIVVVGGVGRIRARLEHHDKRDLHCYFARHNEYSSWEAARWTSLHQRSDVRTLPIRQRIKYTLIPTALMPIGYFLGSYIFKGGFLDGRAGLMFALAKMSYFWQVVLKIRERQDSGAAAHGRQ
jgi:glycosyltransferase involved in cell wall biosynthesis